MLRLIDCPSDHHKAGRREMKILSLLLAVCTVSSACVADDMALIEADTRDWVALSGEDIRAALTDRRLSYPANGATQHFFASGRTLYIHEGQESWGVWQIDGDAYCSQWPPSDLWACYDVGRFETLLRFVAPGPDVTEAVYAD